MRKFFGNLWRHFVEMMKAVFWFAAFVGLYIAVGKFVAGDSGLGSTVNAVNIVIWPVTIVADLIALCWCFIKFTVAAMCSIAFVMIVVGTFLLLIEGK